MVFVLAMVSKESLSGAGLTEWLPEIVQLSGRLAQLFPYSRFAKGKGCGWQRFPVEKPNTMPSTD
jgi:hypothetical protein